MSSIVIDFGTTRTKVATYSDRRQDPDLIKLGREVHEIVPSVIYVPRSGEFVVGDDAQEWAVEDPAGVIRGLKKEIHLSTPITRNDRICDRVDLAATFFSYIRNACMQRVFHGEELVECRMTVPVRFDELQRRCLRDAARKAGFQSVAEIEEPVAAATHWLRQHPLAGDGIVVCDIGGGTTDIALLRRFGNHLRPYAEIPSAGLNLGGNDVDDWIWERLATKHDFVDKEIPGLKVQLRRAKEWLLRSKQAECPLKSGSISLPVSATLVRQGHRWFLSAVAEELRRFASAMAALKISAVQLLLVGGGSWIPDAASTIRTEAAWDADVVLWEDSEYATVLGAVSAQEDSPPSNMVQEPGLPFLRSSGDIFDMPD